MTDEHVIDFQSKLKLTRMQASHQIDDGNLHVVSIGFFVHHKDYTVWGESSARPTRKWQWINASARDAFYERTPTPSQELNSRTKRPTKSNSMHRTSINQTETIFICSDLKHNIRRKIRSLPLWVVTWLSSDLHITFHLLTCLHRTPTVCFPSWRKEIIKIKKHTLGALNCACSAAAWARIYP